jgi:hypothetical protein
MIKYKTISFHSDKKGTSQNLKNWMATNELSATEICVLRKGKILHTNLGEELKKPKSLH